MSNIREFFSENNHGIYSIKLDELAISPRARWRPSTNEILGFCYSHKLSSMTFNNYWNLLGIVKRFQDNQIHLAKEALCIVMSKVCGEIKSPKPVCILPVCTHNITELESILSITISSFKENNSTGWFFF